MYTLNKKLGKNIMMQCSREGFFFKRIFPFKWLSTYHEPAHPSALIFVLATKKRYSLKNKKALKMRHWLESYIFYLQTWVSECWMRFQTVCRCRPPLHASLWIQRSSSQPVGLQGENHVFAAKLSSCCFLPIKSNAVGARGLISCKRLFLIEAVSTQPKR